jgi:RNA-directed DNA polymerase
MREPDAEGIATHSGPESCGHGRKDMPEALTGVRAGRVLSRERNKALGADAVQIAEGNTNHSAIGEEWWTRRGRQTLSMLGSTLRENREIP